MIWQSQANIFITQSKQHEITNSSPYDQSDFPITVQPNPLTLTQVHNTNKNHTKIKRKPNKQKHKQALGTFKSLHLDTSAQPINTGANQGQTPVHPSLFSMLTAAADQGERNYMARTSPGTDFPTQSDTLLSQR